MTELTQERVKELLHYDSETGIFTRLVTVKHNARKGDIISCINKAGYVVGNLDGKLYLMHRVAFLYVEGRWPYIKADHKDTIRNNNKWDNLREATHFQNQCNSTIACNNKTGIKGVFLLGSGKYRASIRAGGKTIHIGTYETKEQAGDVIMKVRQQLHGEFANHG